MVAPPTCRDEGDGEDIGDDGEVIKVVMVVAAGGGDNKGDGGDARWDGGD